MWRKGKEQGDRGVGRWWENYTLSEWEPGEREKDGRGVFEIGEFNVYTIVHRTY